MKERKMQVVANKVRMDDEDFLDVQFWLKQPASARIAEVTRLRNEYYSWLMGEFPSQMVKTVLRRKI